MFPNEIEREIISYVPNIETRMNFNIFHKLKDNFKQILDTTIRKPPVWTFPHQHYIMEKNIGFSNHNHGIYKNDFIEVIFNESSDKIHIELHIWKLVKRPYEGFKHINDSYMLGEFRKSHYWKSISSTYTL